MSIGMAADYLSRYCDSECEGITCTDTEYEDADCLKCLLDTEGTCCRGCLVGFAKEELILQHQSEHEGRVTQ